MHQRKKILIITGLVLVYAFALYLSFNLNLDEKITTMLPDKDSEVEDFIFAIDNLPIMDALYIDVRVNSDIHMETAKKTADHIFEALGDSAFFKDVLYKISADDLVNLVELMDHKKKFLTSESDLSEIKSSLKPEAFPLIFSEIKRDLMGPAGLFSVQTIRKDPLKINEKIMKKLEPFKAMAAGIKITEGRITSVNGKHILMVAHPQSPAVDTVKGKAMMDFLNNLRKNHETEEVNIGFSGAHVATLDNSLTIQKDVKRTLTALSLAIIIIGALFFRQKFFVILIFFPACFGLTLASAIISFFNHEVSAIAIGCGAVLVGITVDFGIHLLFHLDQTDQTGEKEASKLFSTMSRPLATCSGTTAIALFSLLFSSIPGQRQMGLFAGTGVIIAALFAGLGLVYFLPPFPKRNSKPLIDIVKICSTLFSTKKKNRKMIFMGVILLFMISSLGIPKFKFQGNISDLNHLTPRVQMDSDIFMETWGNTTAVTVLVQADTIQEALEKNDLFYDLSKELELKGEINKTSSLAEILPSIKTQKKNKKMWEDLWTPIMVEKTRKLFEIEGSRIGFASNTFAPFFENIEVSPSFIKPEDFRNTAIRDLIDSRIVLTDQGKTVVVTTFETLPGSDMADLKTIFKRAIPGIVVFDQGHFTRHMAGKVSAEFIKISLIAVFAIFFTLVLFMKDLRMVFIAVLPIMAGGYLTIGFLGLFNIPINLISILFIVFVFGVGVDFGVFMIHQRVKDINEDGEGNNLAVTCGSVIICAMTTIVAFLCLMAAEHQALRSIGAAGFIGMLSCLLICLVFIPLLPNIIFIKRTRLPV